MRDRKVSFSVKKYLYGLKGDLNTNVKYIYISREVIV